MTEPPHTYGRQDPHRQGYPRTQAYPQQGYPQQQGYSTEPEYGHQVEYGYQSDQPERSTERSNEPKINVGRLWAGGVGTAIVVALVIVVLIMLVRGILNIAVLSPEGEGAYGTVSTTSYAVAGGAAAIAATGLLNLLLALMPSPMQFFYWITGLVTALAALVPFTLVAGVDAKIATAVINLIAGLCIISLLGGVGSGAIIRRPQSQY
ncbi:DUF6069 family protein [Nocardia testacea]|uniref:DUF6069 family protein n=1 Tax=Nocardia testacea TaxID=248551 RepID=UPI0002DBEEB2|nr:DUF6069 family protein [Nocardia testacea]